MKSFFTASLLSIFLFSGIASADDASVESNYDPRTSQVFELEEGPMQEDAQTFGLGSIIKKIIKGVIIAESLDRDHGNRGYRGEVTCYAENRRRETFRAKGNRPNQVQARAMDKCLRESLNCRPLGCQTDRW